MSARSPSPGALTAQALLELSAVACGRGSHPVLEDVSFSLHAGEVLGVLGPNGVGKSTLLAVMAGEWPPLGGELRFDGRPMGRWNMRDLARRRAVLPQSPTLSFDLPVATVIGMGLYPHLEDGHGDDGALTRARGLAGVDVLADRAYGQLSGGEQQRVQFARVLTQVLAARPVDEARLMLLDEPTASLDPRHQLHLLDAARSVARDEGIGVAVVLHDVNLAAICCDRLLLFAHGRLLAAGRPATVLTPAHLEAAYELPVTVLARPDGEEPLVLFGRR